MLKGTNWGYSGYGGLLGIPNSEETLWQIFQEELESAAGVRDVWNTLLSLLPPATNPKSVENNGWMECFTEAITNLYPRL